MSLTGFRTWVGFGFLGLFLLSFYVLHVPGWHLFVRQELLQWKRPLRSLTVMNALLLVAYFDLVRYGIPLVLLGNVAYIYGNVAGFGFGFVLAWFFLSSCSMCMYLY